MKLVKQPRGSKLCGQCCIAMIANLTLKEVRLCIGVHLDEEGTTRKQLSKCLKRQGFGMSRKLIGKCMNREFFNEMPCDAIVEVLRKGELHHWVVWDAKEKQLLDPNMGVRKKFPSVDVIAGFFVVSRI